MAKTRQPDTPIEHRALVKRRRLAPEGKVQPALLQLLDVSLDGVLGTQVSQQDGRLRVVAKMGGAGVDRHSRPRTEAVRLNSKLIKATDLSLKVPGHRPPGLATTFKPMPAQATHQLPMKRGKGLDRAGSIFGADDRRLFDDTSFPWCTTGKVRTNGKWGSGTAIGPRHVLTASHVVDWGGADKDGTVPGLTFTPGYFDGHGPWGDFQATKVIYWEQAPSSSVTDEQTAFDYVVLVMEHQIGDFVGYAGFQTYDSAWNDGSFWQYIGYPGELSSGERPAFQGDCVISTVQEESILGRKGYVLGHFNEFTPGQSGGSVWGWWGEEPWPRVVGVGSTIGDTAVKKPTGTNGDNEYGGGPALAELIAWARSNFP